MGRIAEDYPDDVCIVGGAGHIGLPLGLAFAQREQRVVLYDLNAAALDAIRHGRLPFIENGAEEILRRTVDRTLFVSSDIQSVGRARFVVVTVGTPVDEYLTPALRAVPKVITALRPYLSAGQTLIIRSTIFPGTCRQVVRILGGSGDAWKVAYCPERIAQGHAIRELADLPQVVAGVNGAAYQDAADLFSLIAPRIIRVTVEEAELLKLFTNAWRYIQFATANQFYMMAHDLGVDFQTVWRAMTDGYGRTAGLPTPGFAAGPCLMKDTMQVVAATNGRFSLGQTAMTVNEGMPAFLVEQLRRRRELRGARVGILGTAFKANIDDIRDSLAYKLRKILEFHGAQVLCSDEYVTDATFVTKEALVSSCDVIIIGAPHTAYRTLTIPEGVELVDLWGTTVLAATLRAVTPQV